MPELPKVDEFSFVLMAGILFIFILGFAWTTPTESQPVVVQTSFELTAAAGEKTTFDFTVSGKPQLTAVNLTAVGEIKSWITFSKNNFDVSDSTTVTVTMRVPASASEGIYSGRVIVEGEGGRDSFSINVEVTGERRELESRPVYEFPSEFTVSYYEGTDSLDSKSDIKVSKSYFSSRTLTLTGLMSKDKLLIVTGGNIRLIIEDTNSIGDLIVTINDNEIYRRKVSVGEVVIPLSKDYIERSNIITIKSGPPGGMFWANSFYNIRLAEFNADYKGAFAKSFNITLSKNEVDNFKQFKLFYRVPPGGYTLPLPLLMIKINNQIAYWDTPKLVFFDDKLYEDMFGNPLYLNEGTNTITFLFEENARYTIVDAMLTVEYYE